MSITGLKLSQVAANPTPLKDTDFFYYVSESAGPVYDSRRATFDKLTEFIDHTVGDVVRDEFKAADLDLKAYLEAKLEEERIARIADVDQEENDRIIAVQAEKEARMQSDDILTQKIKDEQDARIAAVQAEAQARINGDAAEAAARNAADAEILEALATEATQRSAADTAIMASLSNEVTARAQADTALTKAIADEGAARAASDASLIDALTEEETARVAAVASLQTALAAETSARTTAVSTLTKSISDEAKARSDADAAETNARIAAVKAEADARTAADQVLSTAISTETNNRTVAISAEKSAREAAISTEQTARIAADNELEDAIEAQSTQLSAAIATEKSARESAIASEKSARESAISTEQTARIAGDTALANSIANEKSLLVASIASEKASRESAVSAEQTARIAGDAAEKSAREAAISTEKLERIAGDQANQSAFNEALEDEIDARTVAIEAEKNARIAADNALNTSIQAEANARIAAVSTEETARIAAVSAEENARIASVNAVAGRVSVIEGILPVKADLVGGKIPAAQLPAYVDDVLEFSLLEDLPVEGEPGKIYVVKVNNLTYRWSGTAYVEISKSLAVGETSSTAHRGDHGKIAYDHSQLTNANPHGTTKAHVGLGNVDNTADINKPVSTATQSALDLKADITYVDDELAKKVSIPSLPYHTVEGDYGRVETTVAFTSNSATPVTSELDISTIPVSTNVIVKERRLVNNLTTNAFEEVTLTNVLRVDATGTITVTSGTAEVTDTTLKLSYTGEADTEFKVLDFVTIEWLKD